MGRSYAQELRERVLDPLGLSRTELPTTRRLPDLADGGYNPNLPWAAGAIVSNAHDLSRFYSALLSGRLLSAASLEAMKATASNYGVVRAGLGIFSIDLACGRSWGHGGGILDYGTLVTASEEGDRVAVVSLHGRGYIPWIGRALLCAEPALAAGSRPAKSRIAFTSSIGPGPSPLYVANADGSGQRWLTLSAWIKGYVWSPDGRTIAFESLREPLPNGEIYVVNADGSGQRNLTRNPARDFAPAWSPDGRRIAFVRDRGRGRTHRPEIYVMNADGSRQSRLVRRGRRPIWSPDGRRLAFTRGQGGGSVYVVNVDGSEERDVTRGSAARLRLVAGRAEARLRSRWRDLRRERRRGGAAEVDAQRRSRRRSRLVAGRTEDRIREPARPQRRDLRHDRRWQEAAETHAQPGVGFQSGLLAGRSEDCLREHARRQPGGLRHEFGRERAAESDAQPVGRRLGCLVAAVASGQVTVI